MGVIAGFDPKDERKNSVNKSRTNAESSMPVRGL